MRSLLSIVRYVSDDSFSSEISRFANCSWVAWEGDRGKEWGGGGGGGGGGGESEGGQRGEGRRKGEERMMYVLITPHD